VTAAIAALRAAAGAATNNVDFFVKKDELLQQIRTWCQPFVAEGVVVVDGAAFELQDEAGHFVTAGLRIRVSGLGNIDVVPVARHVVGARGRVDLVAGHTTETLVLKDDGTWVTPRRRSPARDERVFNSSLFLELLAALASVPAHGAHDDGGGGRPGAGLGTLCGSPSGAHTGRSRGIPAPFDATFAVRCADAEFACQDRHAV
jgi:hypothetical protein